MQVQGLCDKALTQNQFRTKRTAVSIPFKGIPFVIAFSTTSNPIMRKKGSILGIFHASMWPVTPRSHLLRPQSSHAQMTHKTSRSLYAPCYSIKKVCLDNDNATPNAKFCAMDHSPLGGLPAKIRLDIYHHVFAIDGALHLKAYERHPHHPPGPRWRWSISQKLDSFMDVPLPKHMLALTRTCRQLRFEAWPICFAINEWTITPRHVELPSLQRWWSVSAGNRDLPPVLPCCRVLRYYAHAAEVRDRRARKVGSVARSRRKPAAEAKRY